MVWPLPATIFRLSEACSREFNSTFDEEEYGDLFKGQCFFYLCFVLPTFVYYVAKVPDPRPRFPATISWTIRKGPAKWCHHFLWSVGWAYVLRAFWNRPLGLIFATQMAATGVVAIVLAPCGHTKLMDTVHYTTAAVYIFDHVPLFYYLRVPSIHLYSFSVCFVVFASATYCSKRFRERSGVYLAPGANADAIATTICKNVDLSKRRWLRALGCLEMAGEFGLFFAFVSGMLTGQGNQGTHEFH